jgi:hypothetical protein
MKRKRTPFVKRHHLALGADYALRLIRLFTDVFDGDIMLALVFIAAAQAGTQHLRNVASPSVMVTDAFFPDEVRRPVSISALARSLGLPVETTRRYVVKLVELGFARRTEGGGMVVTTDMLDRDEIRAAARANAANMEHLIDGLLRVPKDR